MQSFSDPNRNPLAADLEWLRSQIRIPSLSCSSRIPLQFFQLYINCWHSFIDSLGIRLALVFTVSMEDEANPPLNQLEGQIFTSQFSF